MSQYESSQIRNLAFVGHGDAGKTSVVSAILYSAGETKRLLSVDEGNTITDFDEDEIKRKISISTGICNAVWSKTKLNLLDTPGYSDFICDAFPALRSADVAVFVVNGGSGIECNLERLWESEDALPDSRVFLINKLDRENTSFDKTLDIMRNELSQKVTPVALPLGKEAGFEGIIDLINQKALKFDPSGNGKYSEMDIPAEYADQVEEARVKLIEGVAEADDELLEKYLEGQDISSGEILKALKAGINSGDVYPAIPVSAAKNIGISYFLNFTVDYLPSPAEKSPIEIGDHSIEVDPSQPLVAQVFKTIIDPYAGKVSVFRIYSGKLATDSTVKNSSRNENEKVAGMFFLQGKSQNNVTEVNAGDIAAIAKLKVTKTGDTLTASDGSIVLPQINYPDPLFSYSFTPITKNDEEKISSSLTRIAEEDPTLVYERNAETNELIVSGMGQLHLEVTQDRLKRKYGVSASVKKPKIPYRETVKGTGDVRYRHKKQTGGAGQFGEVAIELKPLPRGEGFEFVNAIVGGVIPAQFIPSVEKGVRNIMDQGIIAGFKVVDIQVRLYDGKTHPVDSKDIAFQIAGAQAVRQAFDKAKAILLEPIMKIHVKVPESNMGDVIGDLNSKRGKVVGMEASGKKQIIHAEVPMAEIQMYEPEIRSMTGGRGSFTMEFDHYEELPSQLMQEVVAEIKKDSE